jgi:hypothetical protein
MVKNINTLHLTEKIRLGRYTSETQPENTIILNASKTQIPQPSANGFYASPIRYEKSMNVLMYNPESKEIVFGDKLSLESITESTPSSNVKTSFKHLEVEQLDVINVTSINKYYIENPEFVIGKTDCDTRESPSIKMIHGKDTVSIDYDGSLNFSSEKPLRVTIDGSLDTTDINVDTCTSKVYHGDGGLLSNLSYEQLGYRLPELHISKDVYACKYHGDGSLLTGIQLDQISNTTTGTLTMNAAVINGGTFIGKELYVNGVIQSEKTIYGRDFVGDGRKLYGLAQKTDLISNVSRIETLESLKPEIDKIKTIENEIPKVYVLEKSIQDVEVRVSETEKLESRFSKLEYIPEIIDKHTVNISSLSKKADVLESFVPTIKKSNSELNGIIPIVESTEKRITNAEKIYPRVDTLENKVKNVETYLPIVSNLETYVPRIEKVELLVPAVNHLNTFIPKIKSIEPIVGKLQTYMPKVDTLEQQIPRFEPLEEMVSNVYSSEKDIKYIKTQITSVVGRVENIEAIPISTLQSVTEQQSNTVVSTQFENPGVSLSTIGNIGVGTSEASSRITIFSEPRIVSTLGEVDAIKINELAQINAYTKSNNGTSSGRPGGIVFKTRRPSGSLQESMTIDGNGCVTIGSATSHPSAALSIDSKTRGLLVPRMTFEELNLIRKPEPGLIVYDTENDTFWGYKLSGWTKFC